MTESQQPNPFSREGSNPSEGLSSDSSPDEATPPYQQRADRSDDRYSGDWPSYPAGDPYGGPAVDPYGRPVSPYGSSNTGSIYTGPGLESQPMPSYGDPGQPYGESPYGNPYEANPYQTSFGGVSPYGAPSMPSPTPTTPHPQAALALILGILGTVLGFGCIIGGLVGIGGIVVGRRVKNEIDADPGRYSGRSQAVAGIVTGIIGVSICVLVTLFIVLAIVAGISSSF
ncbi:MAG TPA: hypothetical protein VFT17_06650 [Propionibacteriaceae bacterium]|nr:hypothetical protein [Propionibacteriaceae bacterium]